MEPPVAHLSPSGRLSVPSNAPSTSPPKRARPPHQTIFSPLESDDDPAQQTSMSAPAPGKSPPVSNPGERASAHVCNSISRLRNQYEGYRRVTGSHTPRKRQRTLSLHTTSHATNFPSPGAQGITKSSNDTRKILPSKPEMLRPKPLHKTSRLNGCTHGPSPTHRNRSTPSSLWEDLAEAKRSINAQPRADVRFVPKTRPLEYLQHLKTSIVVTLFPDGYVRHDWSANNSEQHPAKDQRSSSAALPTAKQGTLSPKQQQSAPVRSPNIDQLPRYPYDRSSADFLRSLDLGLIPHSEDLPEPHLRFYYDGCLLAEICDRRAPLLTRGSLRREGHQKILLRPHMSSVYQDLSLLTANVEPGIAQLVESEVLRLISPSVCLDPHPQLTSYLSGAGVHTNTHPLNIIRIPKRQRICRPPGAPYVPSLSTAVMLLLSATDKQQAMQRNNSLVGRSTFSESSSTATQATNAVVSSVPSPGTAVHSAVESLPAKDPAQRPASKLYGPHKQDSTKTLGQPRRYLLPSKQLLSAVNRRKSSAQGLMSAVPVQGNPQRQQQRAFQTHERLRMMRLILPDRQLAIELQQAQAQAQAAATTGGAVSERTKVSRTQMLLRTNKPGMPVNIVEMVRHPNQAVEILFVKGITGEKNRDIAHVVVSCEEDGNLVMDQFKAIAKKEGYVCYHDLSAADLHAYQQQQQQARASYQQRQMSGEMVNAHGGSTSRQPLQQSGKQSQQTRSVQRSARQGSPAGAVGIQQIQHVQSKQKQLQAQRHQHQIRRPQQQQQHSQHQQQLHQQSHHQLLRQQQLQHQHQLQQLQNQRRVREQMQQLQRFDKTVHQSASALIPSGRGGQAVSKGVPTPGASVQMPRVPGGSASLNTAGLTSLANGGTLTPSQIFSPAQLQQLQQVRPQQMRVDQHRGMLAAVTRNPGSFNQAGNLTASGLTPQQLQNQALVAVMGSAAMNAQATVGSRGITNTSISADGLNRPRIPPRMKHQRENVETSSRAAKR